MPRAAACAVAQAPTGCCRGDAFARAYEASALKQSNDEELDAALQQRSALTKDAIKELAVTQATVTPFWWALCVMFKVRCRPPCLQTKHADVWRMSSKGGCTGSENFSVTPRLAGRQVTYVIGPSQKPKVALQSC